MCGARLLCKYAAPMHAPRCSCDNLAVWECCVGGMGSVEVPHLDKSEVLALLEGLPEEHFPVGWAEADGRRGGPLAAPAGAQAASEPAGAASGGADRGPAAPAEPAKVRRDPLAAVAP